MASSGASATPESTHTKILQHLRDCLKCTLCYEKPPRNVHICPRCSEMYCYDCARQKISSACKNKCPRCNETVHINQLIKLRCFDVDADQLAADLASLHVAGPSSSSSTRERVTAEVSTKLDTVELALDSRRTEVTPIAVGRQEPIEGLPPAVHGTFTLRNFRNCRLPWICSEHVVDQLGFKWRLKISARNSRSKKNMVAAYVELLFGEEGFYEVLLELQNVQPCAFLLKGTIKQSDLFGMTDFLDKRTLPRNNFDLQLRYTIRPADFEAKVRIQQRLLSKHKVLTREMAGSIDTFHYCINYYSRLDLEDILNEEFDDSLGSRWTVGVHENSKFAEFELTLASGFPGIYKIEAELTHPIAGREKQLAYERNIQLNQRNFFNFRIEWDQLEEYGYDYGDEDRVFVVFNVRALQVDLKLVQDAIQSDSKSDEEYYSSSD